MASKGLIILGVLTLVVGYLGYVNFPEACDYPFHMKLYYILLRLVTNVSYICHCLGGSYVAFMRLMETDVTMGMRDEGVQVSRHTFGGVPTTIFSPTKESDNEENAPAIIYFHGGGWTVGSVELYSILSRSIAKHTGMKVIFPQYRLAPEHPYPTGLQDCVAATVAFAEEAANFGVSKDKLLFVGDSAGGNLAVAVSFVLATDEDAPIEPCHMALIYPLLQISNFMLPSYRKNANAPLLDPAVVARVVALYMGIQNFTDLIPSMVRNLHMQGFQSDGYGGRINSEIIPDEYKRNLPVLEPYHPTETDKRMLKQYKKALQKNAADPLFSPLAATDDLLRLLPDTHIMTSEFDVLRDDGLILYQRMKSLGLDVTYRNMEFAAHGIANLFGAVKYDKLTNAMMEFVDILKEESLNC